jgi:hypothetical protein
MLARPTVDKFHYLKTGFPNKVALRCSKSANYIRFLVVGPMRGSQSQDTVQWSTLRRDFAVVNYLSFEMQHSLFELRGKAHYAS